LAGGARSRPVIAARVFDEFSRLFIGKGRFPALPKWQSEFDIYGSSSRFAIPFHPAKMSGKRRAWAPSRRDSGGIAGITNPALKRGANNRCAYGAGNEADAGIARFYTGSFEGPPTIKPFALPADTNLPVCNPAKRHNICCNEYLPGIILYV
jgi:hypothetical protein